MMKFLRRKPTLRRIKTGKRQKIRTFAGILPLIVLATLLSGGLYGQDIQQEEADPIYSSSSVPAAIIAEKLRQLDEKLAKSAADLRSASLTDPRGELRKKPLPLTVFGYYRLFLYGRNMTEPYPNLAPYEKAYGVGDGYREPTMSLNVVGRPNGKTSFGTELFLLNPYLGTGPADNVFQTNLGLNFYGNFRTEAGNFGVRAGGIHWYNLSPFTIGVYQVLDRYSIFDRTPWEGVSNTTKYENYFETGSVNVGDLRWNFQPFQGIIVNGGKLPGNMNFDLFWGKTQPNGGLINAQDDPFATIINPNLAGNIPTYAGFAGDLRVRPSFITGGKIGTTFGKKRNTVNYNLIDSRTAIDSIDLQKNWRNYQVHSLSFSLDVKGINITGELGAGSFQSPIYDKDWGEALMVRVKTPKAMTGIPLDVQLYQISQNFYNENGEINTTNNPAIQANFPNVAAAGQLAIGGLITQVNQLAHNRRGVNLNTGVEIGDLRLNLGWGLAAEIDPGSASLSYIHRINGLALSRVYNPFPANATSATVFGPYGRQFSFFRGVSERVLTTDLDPATATPKTRKYFNAVDLQGKYKMALNDRPLYFFYLGTLGSAKSEAALLPSLDDKSYLFVQYHEFDLYYELLDKFIVTGYFGLEVAKGGTFTEWDLESQLPRDQVGTGVGVGFDWMISPSAGIYVRHRWMNFEDRSFSLDHYRGREVTIELKSYF